MISSNEIKRLKSLAYKKYRKRYSQYLIEGKRVVEEAIKSNSKPIKIWTTGDFLECNLELKMLISQYTYDLIDSKLFSEILNTKNPQHIMALLPIEHPSHKDTNSNILILDNISDPGNMGTILRTVAWYGINTVICSESCVDIYNPKVIRSGMGAHFYIDKIIYADLYNYIKKLKDQSYTILAATLCGEHHKNIKINSPWALVLGNEAHGISASLKKCFDLAVSIPQRQKIDSLNVAIAGSIILDRLVD